MGQLSERARQFLQAPNLAILATLNVDGTPQLTGMWYELEKDEASNNDIIVMNTVRGRLKERNMQLSPWVSVCIVSRKSIYQYVTIGGHARLIDDPQRAQEGILRLATRYDGAAAAQYFIETTAVHQERVSIHVSIEEIYEYWGVNNRQLVEGWGT